MKNEILEERPWLADNGGNPIPLDQLLANADAQAARDFDTLAVLLVRRYAREIVYLGEQLRELATLLGVPEGMNIIDWAKGRKS